MMSHTANVGIVLAQCRRRWAGPVQALCQHLILNGRITRVINHRAARAVNIRFQACCKPNKMTLKMIYDRDCLTLSSRELLPQYSRLE